MTARVDKYNEHKYSQKIYLLYNGIHYDPLYWDSAVPGLPFQTIFQATESGKGFEVEIKISFETLFLWKFQNFLVVEQHVVELARTLRAARQYTDTGMFSNFEKIFGIF